MCDAIHNDTAMRVGIVLPKVKGKLLPRGKLYILATTRNSPPDFHDGSLCNRGAGLQREQRDSSNEQDNYVTIHAEGEGNEEAYEFN